jgi:hypothetical protein
MTGEQEERLLRIVREIGCKRARICYETGLKPHFIDRDFTDEDLKNLLKQKSGNCPYENSFGPTYVCNCPLCDYSTICKDPYWAPAGKEPL